MKYQYFSKIALLSIILYVCMASTPVPGKYPGSTFNYCSKGYCVDCTHLGSNGNDIVQSCQQCAGSKLKAVTGITLPSWVQSGITLFECDGTSLIDNCQLSENISPHSPDLSQIDRCGMCSEGYRYDSGTNTCVLIPTDKNCLYSSSDSLCYTACKEGFKNDNRICSAGDSSTLIANCKLHGWDSQNNRQNCFECQDGYGQTDSNRLQCVQNGPYGACAEFSETTNNSLKIDICSRCNWRRNYFDYASAVHKIYNSTAGKICIKLGQEDNLPSKPSVVENNCNNGGKCSLCKQIVLPNYTALLYCNQCFDSLRGTNTKDCTGGPITEQNCLMMIETNGQAKGCKECKIGFEPYQDGVDAADNNKKIIRCRTQTTSCRFWFVDEYSGNIRCNGCDANMKVNSAETDCESGGKTVPNCQIGFWEYYPRCKKCTSGYYWDGMFCTKSPDYKGGLDTFNPKYSYSCNYREGWSSVGLDSSSEGQICENPSYTAPAKSSTITNDCGGKCAKCKKVGEHFSCVECYESLLVKKTIVDGVQLYGCEGTDTGIDNCKMAFNELKDEGKVGCDLCAKGYRRVLSNDTPKVGSCVSGGITGCAVYLNASGEECKYCESGYLRVDTTSQYGQCQTMGSTSPIANCAFHRKQNNDPMYCQVCNDDYVWDSVTLKCIPQTTEIKGCLSSYDITENGTKLSICTDCNLYSSYFSVSEEFVGQKGTKHQVCGKDGIAPTGSGSGSGNGESSSKIYPTLLSFILTVKILFMMN